MHWPSGLTAFGAAEWFCQSRNGPMPGTACTQAANRLPRPAMHAAARTLQPELRSGFAGLSDGAAATLDTLLDLQARIWRTTSCV